MKTNFSFYSSLLLFLLVLGACESSETEVTDETDISNMVLHDEWRPFFDEFGLEGGMIVWDMQEDVQHVYGKNRLNKRFLPASTFKIPNSLIALESGAVVSVDDTIKWDGEERMLDVWNQDHTLRSGIKHSVVWFYQEVARRVGEEKMQMYVDSMRYGNQDISGGIDRFWLDGGLRISMLEQIDFLHRLYRDELPFEQETLDSVKNIMIREETEDYVIRAKTGWAARTEPDIGWYVGYVERAEKVYFFALNVETDLPAKNFAMSRVEITRMILEEMNLL